MRIAALCFVLVMLPPLPAYAQSNTGCERMQTEEEYQKCIERSGKPREVSPQIFGQGNSNVPAPGPLQQDILESLPVESQRHLRSEMAKKVYAEVGEWTPEARAQEFDYAPSAAAQEDPELKAEEEAAFAAAVSDYHDREQEAYESRQSGGGNATISNEVTAPTISKMPQIGTNGQSRSTMEILGDLTAAGSDTADAPSGDAAGGNLDTGTNTVVAGDATVGAQQGQADAAALNGRDGTQAEDQDTGAQTVGTAPMETAGTDGENHTEDGSGAQAQNAEAEAEDGGAAPPSAAEIAGVNRSADDLFGALDEAEGTSDGTAQSPQTQNAAAGSQEGSGANPAPPQSAGAKRTTDEVLGAFGQEEASDSATQRQQTQTNQPQIEDVQTEQAHSQQAQNGEPGTQEAFATNTGIATSSGTERSAEELFGALSKDEASSADTSSQQSQSSDAQTPSSQTQSEAQSQTASNGTPSGQSGDPSNRPPAPTRPIPSADALSAQLLAKLFDNKDQSEQAPSFAPFEDWSEPESEDSDMLGSAAQTILEAPAEPDTPPEPATPSQSARLLEKEAARLVHDVETGDVAAEEQARREADIAAQQSALDTMAAASSAKPAAPAKVIQRLNILGLP